MINPSAATDAWKEFTADPLPGWGSRSTTLFDCPAGRLGLDSGDVAIASVPLDATAMSRPGSAGGPSAIRLASHVYRNLEDSRGTPELINLRTDENVRTRDVAMRDYGDLHVYPVDMERQVKATAAEVHRLALDHALTVVLGGEHSISFPAYVGVAAALEARDEGSLGYVQVDHHFDFGERAALYGPVYQGSNARRISEVRTCNAGGQAFVGVGDITSRAQYASLRHEGYGVYTMQEVRRHGFAETFGQAANRALETADRLYVSLDVDVCDSAALPGTGNITIGGITTRELLEMAACLRRIGSRLAAVDIVELAPRYDPSGVTSSVIARLLFEAILLEDS